MADKIKSFFQRKVKDKKFSNAGAGHRLTDSNPKAATTSKAAAAPKRHEPTSDARVAGQAALARIEKMQAETREFNPSYTAFKARIKREIEEEKTTETVTQKLPEDRSSSSEKSEDVVLQPHLMAVSGVYYRCPLVSDEILDKETWYERLEEFFSAQLASEDEGLSACLVIRNCNAGEKRVNACIETLCKYLENIRSAPSEPKYWKIRMSNKVFQEKVAKYRGSLKFLEAAGFAREKLMHQDKEEDFLVWSPERSSVENLTTLMDALVSAESVELILDRNVQVLSPSQASARSELPMDFYVLSAEELKKLQVYRTKDVEQGLLLMTQAMREKMARERERKYRFTLIRIRFPDNIILQGTFAVSETYKDIAEFVREHLLDEWNGFSFHLITAARQKLTEADSERTLEALNLVPAVVLTFHWKSNSDSEPPSQFLKDETLSFIQSL